MITEKPNHQYAREMKPSSLIIFLLLTIASSAFAQDTIKPKTEKQKPKATYQVGAAKVIVWLNKDFDGNTYKNFKVEKSYQKDGQWKTTSTFNESELLELKAALDKAISEENVKVKIQKE